MKIKETYIVQKNCEFVKLHYCTNDSGSNVMYFIEYATGTIELISFGMAIKLKEETHVKIGV